MQVLNKYDKEQLVIKLYQEGRTMRDIASAAHMSFSDIKRVIRSIDGGQNTDLSNKSKASQALYLFEHGKKPIDIAVELDIPYSEVFELQQEYFALKELYDLAFVCMEIGNDLSSFMELYKLLKRNEMLRKKQILKFLSYANEDLPTLENRCRKLGSVSVELQIRKKQLGDEVAALSVSVSQLKKSLNWYETQIEDRKQIISNLDRHLNQKILALEKKLMVQDNNNSTFLVTEQKL